MRASPVLCVLRAEPPLELYQAVAGAGRTITSLSGSEAALAIRPGQLLLCDRVPGWQALIARVDSAGGAAVLYGPPPRADEQRQVLPPDLEAVTQSAAVVEALERAERRLVARAASTRLQLDLLERAESAELVNRFAQSIATQLDLPHVVNEAMARTRELCDADGASLLLVDPLTGELFFDAVAGGAQNEIRRLRLKPGQGVAGRVAQQAQPELVVSAQEDARVDKSCDAQTGFQTGSIIAVPLLFSGDVLGVLEAVRQVGRPPFNEAHLRRLADLSPHVTIAVHNAQMTTRLKETQAQVMSANADLERKVQERTEQIARGKREWERTFDAILEPIALQEGFTVRRANTAYAQQAGRRITEVPGKACFELMAGRNAPCEGCPLLRGAGQQRAGEVPMRDAVFNFSAFEMSSEHSERTFVVHYRDVSGQKALEQRLRETERLAAVGQLASGAAHEINNPLGFLTSNLSNLKTCVEDLAQLAGEKSGEARTLLQDGAEMIDESLDGAKRVAEIVRGLRELAKLEIGRAEPTPVSPSITRAARAEFGEDVGLVELELESQAPVRVPPLQLDQALKHLLKNARQALRAGGRVRVRTTHDLNEVRIEIADEGCGIPSEHLHRIFEPFFTTRGVGKGIGLGLTAAYGIVKRHGGEIHVHSTQGRGSLFIVTLPRAEEAEPQAALMAQPAAGP